MSQRSCAVDLCGRPSYHSQDWCKSHYDRWKRFGDVRAEVPFQRKAPQGKKCSLGCDKPPIARGWCVMHYNRWRLHGDPGPVVRIYQKSDLSADTKTCTSCREVKPKSDFHTENRITDGRASHCKVCMGEKQRDRTLRRKYGITAAMYDAMSEQQGDLCRICQQKPDERGLVVDHCHTTGTVRGLLCNNCNALLGMAADDVARLRSAIHYLERSRE